MQLGPSKWFNLMLAQHLENVNVYFFIFIFTLRHLKKLLLHSHEFSIFYDGINATKPVPVKAWV